MSNIIDSIQLSGVTYTLSAQTSGGSGGTEVVELTQAQYDVLPSSAKTDTSKLYVITDAEEINANDYVTKASNVASGLTSTIEETNLNASLVQVKDVYISASTNCTRLDVYFNSNYFGTTVIFDFQTTPSFGYDYMRVDFDSENRTYHIWSTDTDLFFYNIYAHNYEGSKTFKLWTYTWQIPSGQTASVLNEALPQVTNAIDSIKSSALKEISLSSESGVKTTWHYSVRNIDGTNNTTYGFTVCDGKSIVNDNGLKLADIPTQQIYGEELLKESDCTQTPFGNNWQQDYSQAVNHFMMYFNTNLNSTEYQTNFYYYYYSDGSLYSNELYVGTRNNNGTFEVNYNYGEWTSDYASITSTIQTESNLDITVTSSGIEYEKESGGTRWLSHIFVNSCLYNNDNESSLYSGITVYNNSINLYDAVETLFAEYESGGTSGGITSGQVQTMIDTSISGKADTSAVTAVQDSLSGYVETSAITTAVTSASTDNEIPTAKAVFDAIPTGGGGGTVESAITSASTNAVQSSAIYDAVVYSANTYTTELTFDAEGYAENWIVGQSAITIDVSGYTASSSADYRFENSDGLRLGTAYIYKHFDHDSWNNYGENCTITTDGDTAIITDIPSGTVKIRRENPNNPPKAIISGDTPETWIKDALDDHRDNTTVHITAQERSTWNNKSNFSGSYNDLTDKPIPDSALTSYSTNAVQSNTLYNELRVPEGGQVSDVTVEFDSEGYSTNFPNNCTTVKVEVSGSNNYTNIHFRSGGDEFGYVSVMNYGSINVDNNFFHDSSYEISGNTVIITYPLSKQIDGLNVDGGSTPYTIKATPSVSYTPLKDVVAENTTALGGLSLVKLTQAQYDALTTKDSNTLYVIVN